MGLKARIFNIMQYVVHPITKEPLLTEDAIKIALAHKSITRWAYVLHDKDVYTEADELDEINGCLARYEMLSDEEKAKLTKEEYVVQHCFKKAGTQKHAHWHIVVQCKNQVELGVIARWLGIPENYVEVPQGLGAGKFLDCVEYLTHEHPTQQELKKHRYEDNEIKCSDGFDFRYELRKRAENRLKYGRDLSAKDQMRFDVLYLGKTLKQCQKEDPILYMEDMEKLQKLRLQHIQTLKPPTTRLNYYLCGKGGTGKGVLSRALARSFYPNIEDNEDIFFEVGAKGAAFEGYDGQPVIIWNDRRAVDLLQELGGRGNVFNVFDTHPTKQRQNVKFASINLCNAVNIVNSVQDYIEFLEGLAGGYTDRNGESHEAEDKNQSYRRFPFIMPLHREDFDLLINKGFVDEDDNYTEYYEHKRLIGNAKRIRRMCGTNEELARRLENQMVKQVTTKHNEIVQQFAKHGEVDEKEIEALMETLGEPMPETRQIKFDWGDGDVIYYDDDESPFNDDTDK